MLLYSLQIISFQLLFLIGYDLFLKRETFFNCNRVYLLGSFIFSLILPFAKINGFSEIIPAEYIEQLPEFVLDIQTPVETSSSQAAVMYAENTTVPIWQILFLTGSLISLAIFLYKLLKLYKLKKHHPVLKYRDYNQISIKNDRSTAFSFFRNIFLGADISKDHQSQIIQHELVHIKQFHSIDLLFFECCRILMWFNPLVYLYQQRISDLHEFIADARVVKNSKKAHYELLLSQVFKTDSVSFVNPFNNISFIKKRILMLQKSKSKRVNYFRYLILIPLTIGMLSYVSCEDELLPIETASTTLTGDSLKQQIFDEITLKVEEGISVEEFFKESILFSKKNDDIIKITFGVSSAETETSYYHSAITMLYIGQIAILGKDDQVPPLNIDNERIKKRYQDISYASYLKRRQEAQEQLARIVQDSDTFFEEEAKHYSNAVVSSYNEAKTQYPSSFNVFEVSDIRNLTPAEKQQYRPVFETFFKTNTHKVMAFTDNKRTTFISK